MPNKLNIIIQFVMFLATVENQMSVVHKYSKSEKKDCFYTGLLILQIIVRKTKILNMFKITF